MRWSWRLARIAGVDVEVHATFLLLLAWIGLAAFRRAGPGAAATAVGFALALFASVVLHEYGHVLTARHYGIRTRRITLLPIGGVASLERMPERPRHEFMIAIAGPAVTAAIVALLYGVLRALHAPVQAVPGATTGGAVPFVQNLLWINLTLLFFNLLPAFPMDGGRVLRALIATRTDHARATTIAAGIGKVFALLFALAGLFVVGNPFLVLIALFVWMSAAAESAAVQFKAAAGGATVARAMSSEVKTLTPDDSIARAAEAVRGGFQQDFPVVEGNTVAGVLTRERLLKALTQGMADAPVGEVMQRDFVSARPDEPIDDALSRLQGCHCRALPVMRGDQLVGILTVEKVGEFVMLQSARRNGRPDSPNSTKRAA